MFSPRPKSRPNSASCHSPRFLHSALCATALAGQARTSSAPSLKCKAAPAYSLIFAFVVMTLIMIVAVTTITNTRSKQAFYSGIEGSEASYLAAQSAAEVGILAVKDNLLGYETGGQVENAFTSDSNLDGTPEAYGNYTIIANGKEGSGGEFYLPIFGTGTAGSREDCSVLDYIDPATGDVRSPVSDDDLDNPCNWNKLLYGDSVTIPLYTSDSSGGLVFPAEMSGFTGWDLKVRTPCVDGSKPPESCDRYRLDEDDTTILNPDGTESSASVIGGDSIVKWELTQIFSTGTVTLMPDDEKYEARSKYTGRSGNNTEIYEKLINDASSTSYEVLFAKTPGTYESIYAACTANDLIDLTLTLSIVHSLIDESGVNIPYLEWQFVTDSGEPFADNKSVVVGQGYYQNGSNVYYSPYVVNRSTTGESVNVYTLSN